MILVSACLCGVNTRYDGNSSLDEKVLKLLKQGKAVMVCPEQLGGLSTPRLPHEIANGTGEDVLKGNAEVISKDSSNGTAAFIKGADETLKIANTIGAKFAILKSRSPSCGKGLIYDGSFSGRKIQGNGVTAELLIKNNISVYTEEEFDKIDIEYFIE